MKKKIIFLLLFPIFLQAQSFIYFDAFFQYATLLNGTSQYWSKASPVNMDLNGSEQCRNGTFEADSSYWAFVTNASGKTTNVQKHGGSKSLVIWAATVSPANIQTRLDSGWVTTLTGKVTLEGWFYVPTADSSKTVLLDVLDNNLNNLQRITTTISGNTWTKIVNNVAVNGTQTMLKARIILQNAGKNDSLYIDDVSLTQAYDGMVIAEIRLDSKATTGTLLVRQAGSTQYNFYAFNRTNGIMSSYFDDGVTNVERQGATDITGKTVLWAYTLNRTGNIQNYLNGATDGTATAITGIGKANASATLFVGRGATAAEYWLGQIGQFQIVKFTDISTANIPTILARISANKNKPFPKAYANGQIVFWCDWSKGGYDKSGTGNSVSQTANPIITKIKY